MRAVSPRPTIIAPDDVTRRLFQLETLHEIGRECARVHTLPDVLQVMLSMITGSFAALRGVAFIAGDDGAIEALQYRGVLRDEALQLCEVAESYLQGSEDESRLREAGLDLCLPLHFEGRVRGALALGPRLAAATYSDDDRALLAAIVANAAPYLYNVQLLDALRVASDDLERKVKVLTAANEMALGLAGRPVGPRLHRFLLERVCQALDVSEGMLILAESEHSGYLVAARYGSAGQSGGIVDSGSIESALAGDLTSDDRRECAISVRYGSAKVGALWLRRAAAAPPFGAADQPLLAFLASQTAVILENNRLFEQYLVQQREQCRLRGMLEQYLAPSMVERLIDGPVDLLRKGDLVPVSILMVDIRGSTALINAIAPDMMIDLINEFFARMIDILFAYEGTIEKFVGDGVHGFFGAPVAHDDDPERAVRAAVAMQNAFMTLVAERSERHALPASLAIGIGVATGEVVVGNVGSAKRLAYTMLGPAANLAARLTAAAPAGTIHLDERTWAAAAGPLGLRPRRPRHLRFKGFDGLAPVYRLGQADVVVSDSV